MRIKYLAKKTAKNILEAIQPGLTHKSIERVVSQELQNKLQELCEANSKQLAGNLRNGLISSQSEKINSVLRTRYFQTTASRDGYDGHYRIDKYFQDHQKTFKAELFTSSKQYVLSKFNFEKILPYQREAFKYKAKFIRKILNLLVIS